MRGLCRDEILISRGKYLDIDSYASLKYEFYHLLRISNAVSRNDDQNCYTTD